MYGEWVVIPAVLTKKIFKDFHTGHPGMSRIKALMRSYVCANAPPIKFSSLSKTDKPWSLLHIDFSGSIKRTYFFVIVDSFMKWPEVFKYKMPTTKTTIKVLQELFARFGLPETIVSDNDRPFTSKEFEHFFELLSINHLQSAPYHPLVV